MQNTLKILGSISPYPILNKSCPGYLISLNDKKILLDCGFGVVSRLNFPDDLMNLDIIISHFHKDHYSDLFAIAYASYVYNKLGKLKQKINVYIPSVTQDDDSYLDYELVKTMKEHYFNFIEYDETSVLECGDLSIKFCKNYHSITTYSVLLQNSNFKFVYGADMGFENINKFVKFSFQSDLLMLESSFIKTKDKTSNYHLSAEEAAKIAELSNSKKLILTHLWPEFDIQNVLKESKKTFINTIIAEDNIEFKI